MEESLGEIYAIRLFSTMEQSTGSLLEELRAVREEQCSLLEKLRSKQEELRSLLEELRADEQEELRLVLEEPFLWPRGDIMRRETSAKGVGPAQAGEVILSGIQKIETSANPADPGSQPVEFAMYHSAPSKGGYLKPQVRCKQHREGKEEWQDLEQTFPDALIEEQGSCIIVKIPGKDFKHPTSFAVVGMNKLPGLFSMEACSVGEFGATVDGCYYPEGDEVKLSSEYVLCKDPKKDPSESRKLKIPHSAVQNNQSKWGPISVLAQGPDGRWKDAADVCPGAKYCVAPSEVLVEVPNKHISHDTVFVVVGLPDPGAKKWTTVHSSVEPKGYNEGRVEAFFRGIPITKKPSATMPYQVQVPARWSHGVKLVNVTTPDEGVCYDIQPVIEETAAAACNIPQHVAAHVTIEPESYGQHRTHASLTLELAFGGTTGFLQIKVPTVKYAEADDQLGAQAICIREKPKCGGLMVNADKRPGMMQAHLDSREAEGAQLNVEVKPDGRPNGDEVTSKFPQKVEL